MTSMRTGDVAMVRRRRFSPWVWGGSALAAGVMVLGVSGTLSSWTSAIVTNDGNDVASAAAVSLEESSGGVVCVDTAASATNTATCSTINKYGGTTTPLAPGQSQTVTVSLKNTGTGNGALTLDADACTSSAVAGSSGAEPTAYPLCSQLRVALSCTNPVTSFAAVTPATFAAETGPRVIAALGPNAATQCTFTVTLTATSPAGYASQVASQVLRWTLVAA